MSTIRFRSIAWMITGVMLSMILMVLFQAWQADAAVDDGESAFKPITPCRLMDTRPSSFDNVGPRATPIGAGETYLVQVTGTNGDCTIPGDATGVALNMIALNATAPSFLQVWPADAGQPVRGSNLNYDQNSPPLPNKVDVKLSATGAMNVFNLNGTVDVVGDVVGYYTNSGLQDLDGRVSALEAAPDTAAAVLARLDALEADVAGLETDLDAAEADVDALEADVAGLESDLDAAEADIDALETKLASVSNVTVDGEPTVRFTGVNVQIVDGSGDTGGAVNGRGNLIVGYNENDADTRTGSHNLVVGINNSYSSYSGIVGGLNTNASGGHALLGGYNNTASGFTSSVTGGFANTASGQSAAISGGGFSTASGAQSSVNGGSSNLASLDFSTVSGGIGNTASGVNSSVAGGDRNTASELNSSVAGGVLNTASGVGSSVAGGVENTASGTNSSVAGGIQNTASATSTTVGGGFDNVASANAASVSSGRSNLASGSFSTVLAGQGNQALNQSATAVGGINNVADTDGGTVSGGSGRVITGLGGNGFDWVGGGLFQDF